MVGHVQSDARPRHPRPGGRSPTAQRTCFTGKFGVERGLPRRSVNAVVEKMSVRRRRRALGAPRVRRRRGPRSRQPPRGRPLLRRSADLPHEARSRGRRESMHPQQDLRSAHGYRRMRARKPPVKYLLSLAFACRRASTSSRAIRDPSTSRRAGRSIGSSPEVFSASPALRAYGSRPSSVKRDGRLGG